MSEMTDKLEIVKYLVYQITELRVIFCPYMKHDTKLKPLEVVTPKFPGPNEK